MSGWSRIVDESHCRKWVVEVFDDDLILGVAYSNTMIVVQLPREARGRVGGSIPYILRLRVGGEC
jgi:hypothetical protein